MTKFYAFHFQNMAPDFAMWRIEVDPFTRYRRTPGVKVWSMQQAARLAGQMMQVDHRLVGPHMVTTLTEETVLYFWEFMPGNEEWDLDVWESSKHSIGNRYGLVDRVKEIIPSWY